MGWARQLIKIGWALVTVVWAPELVKVGWALELINLKVLGSPNPGQSFGRGGAFRSGSNGGEDLHVGRFGALKIKQDVVILMFRSLILARGMLCSVVFLKKTRCEKKNVFTCYQCKSGPDTPSK